MLRLSLILLLGLLFRRLFRLSHILLSFGLLGYLGGISVELRVNVLSDI